MAGPTSSVLFRTVPDNATLAKVSSIIDELATERSGNDFYISSGIVSPEQEELRPFGLDMNFITEEHYEYSAAELRSIEDKFECCPQYEIGLYAMCNSITDHKILGLLTLKIAVAVGGLINFGGELDAQKIKNISGKICGIGYETANGHTAHYHVSDTEFMRNWLSGDHFRMIK